MAPALRQTNPGAMQPPGPPLLPLDWGVRQISFLVLLRFAPFSGLCCARRGA
jgi:hypothetical protein